MKILLIGAGKMGKKLVKSLAFENCNITVIDNSISNLSDIETNSRVSTINENGLNKSLLENLNIEEYDYVISATNSDKTNILISTMAKSLGAKFTIARINQTDSVNQLAYIKENLGIDYIVNPHVELNKAITNIFKSEISYQAEKFGLGKIEVTGHNIRHDVEFVGKRIKDIGNLATILVIGILRNDEIIIPNGNTKLIEGDFLYLMGLENDIRNFKFRHFSIGKKNLKKVFIVGSSTYSKEIAEVLVDYDVTISVDNIKDFKKLRTELKDVYVIHEDARDENFFNNREFLGVEGFIAATDSDELNIVLGLMASKLNISKVLVKLESNSYVKILDSLNVTAVLNPLNIATDNILRKLRGDKVTSIYMTFDGKAEIFETRIDDNNEIIGKTLQEINLPSGMLIGGILRKDGSVVIPRGYTKFESGDKLIIFCKNENKRELIRFINKDNSGGLLSNIFYV